MWGWQTGPICRTQWEHGWGVECDTDFKGPHGEGRLEENRWSQNQVSVYPSLQLNLQSHLATSRASLIIWGFFTYALGVSDEFQHSERCNCLPEWYTLCHNNRCIQDPLMLIQCTHELNQTSHLHISDIPEYRIIISSSQTFQQDKNTINFDKTEAPEINHTCHW
jgi:hypothetical protein